MEVSAGGGVVLAGPQVALCGRPAAEDLRARLAPERALVAHKTPSARLLPSLAPSAFPL